MEINDRDRLEKRIDKLEKEVLTINERLSSLEGYKGKTTSVSTDASPQEIARKKGDSQWRQHWQNSTHWRDGLENLVGGKLLNRVAILVLLFGMAYFLKYSFDNNWIGIIGRIIIGLFAGVAFIAAGDITIGRGYRYFSQGLSGGGIAIIYLTTFTAANFYDVFSPAVALTLLVITAMAGGILSVRQNAYGVAVLSTLGGFLAPFLIGSKGSDPLLLLTYITVLDFVVLYLAYYKNWRSLNFLSFLGTVLVYVIFKSGQHVHTDIFVIQFFLIAYFAIFGSLVFLYNVRHKKPTMPLDISLMTLNAGFFLVASLENLYKYPDFHGVFVISLSLLYLVVSIALKRKMMGDILIYVSLLGIGLSLVTIAIAVQMEGDWRNAAWAVEGIVLVYAGIRAGNIWVNRAGLFVMLMAYLFQVTSYVPVYPQYTPLLNAHSLSAFLLIAGFFTAFYLFYSRPALADRRLVLIFSVVLGTLLALRQVSLEVTDIATYYRLEFQVDFAISLSWVLIALIIISIGMLKDIKGLRLMALSLFGITLSKILLFDLSNLDIIFRVLLLFIVGAILLGISFLYQRKDIKGDQQ